MSEPLPSSTVRERRHDLDALRAGAMFLGIAYNISLAFALGHPWVVVDSQRHLAANIFAGILHGFRMPLFFLLSGFFVAMMWRKRGLKYVVHHRLRRVLIPCLLGVVTIVPITFFALQTAPPSNLYAQQPIADAIWQAARWGAVERVAAYLSNGGDPHITEPEFGATLMSLAAYAGQRELVALMIEQGLDVNQRDARGNTPLHAAAYFGHDEIVALLLKAGAQRDIENRGGRTPLDMARVNAPVTMLVANWMNIELAEDRVAAGKSHIVAALSGQGLAEEGTGILAAIRSVPIFLHLWFLWYLWWFTIAFGIIVLIAGRCNWQLPNLRVAVLSPARFVWLIPLTLAPLWFAHEYGGDTSVGLIPKLHVLLYYFVFFAFGALYFESNDVSARLGKHWRFMLPTALLICFPVSFDLATGHLGLFHPLVGDGFERIISLVLQVVYIWLMVLGCMGLARVVLTKESRLIRYLSDSAYWLYLAHVPLVIFAQSFIAEWDQPLALKVTLILVAIPSFLLLTYEYLVRYTFLGTLLNGPRTRG